MNTENTAFQIQQACNYLQDLGSHLKQTGHWCSNSAANAIKNLQDQWANTLNITEQDSFIIHCSDILRNCEAFRDQIDLQNTQYTDRFENRRKLIKQLAGNDADTNSLMAQLLQSWNETVLPQLRFLYEKLEELEQRIITQYTIKMSAKESVS